MNKAIARSVLLFLYVSQSLSAAPDIKFVQSADVKIAYRTFGSGPVLVVINGGPGRSSDTFTSLAEKLSQQNRQVILFDQRGTGKSTLTALANQTVSLDLMVEDLEVLRKHLGQKQISILGHSFGGMYAMAYAAKYPQNVKALVLSASGAIDIKSMKDFESNLKSKLKPVDREKYEFWTSKEQRRKDPFKAKLESLRASASAYVYKQEYVPRIQADLANTDYYNPKVNQLVWMSMEQSRFNLKNAFKSFKAPTLVIDGKEDFLGDHIPREIHENIPSSRLEILAECSHYPWLDKPSEYFKLIDKFLPK